MNPACVGVRKMFVCFHCLCQLKVLNYNGTKINEPKNGTEERQLKPQLFSDANEVNLQMFSSSMQWFCLVFESRVVNPKLFCSILLFNSKK